MTVHNQAMLITYPDSFGGNLATLHHLLGEHFPGLFRGVHILPPFPSSGDRGFAPLTYTEIDPAFGTWDDMRCLTQDYDILVDLMVNHMSRRSPQFQDFVRHGRRSPDADLFITVDKVWPGGDPPAAEVAHIFLRKPDNPFSTVVVEDTGQAETIWTTFGKRDWSEQIDVDVQSPLTRRLLTDYLTFFSRQGIKIVRLDAIGYVVKQPGTTCFMVEPAIYEFIDWLVEVATGLGVELLPEVHDHYSVQLKLAAHGYWVYDFVLPGLLLHTLLAGTSRKLRDYLAVCPRRQFTMLDCHDGIPVQPDLNGILTIPEAKRVVDICLGRGANLNRILSAHKAEDGFDAHQINITYYDALGRADDAYLAARAIQFFAPGVPQVYYVGLLAGENDQAAVSEQGEGRAVNRHNYTPAEVAGALQRPVVQRLQRLIRFRNEHPAFNGQFSVLDSPDHALALAWQNGGARCRLDVDLGTGRAVIRHGDAGGSSAEYQV